MLSRSTARVVRNVRGEQGRFSCRSYTREGSTELCGPYRSCDSRSGDLVEIMIVCSVCNKLWTNYGPVSPQAELGGRHIEGDPHPNRERELRRTKIELQDAVSNKMLSSLC